MTVDLSAAADFLAGSARQLDRRRFDVQFDGGDVGALFAAVDAYRKALAINPFMEQTRRAEEKLSHDVEGRDI